MFKMMLLQSLYNISDKKLEYQILRTIQKLKTEMEVLFVLDPDQQKWNAVNQVHNEKYLELIIV